MAPRKDGRSTEWSGTVYAASRRGHRGSYLDLFSEMFGLEPRAGAIDASLTRHLVAARRLLFATLDDHVIAFALVAFSRAAIGRRTVGIILRPHGCSRHGPPVSRVKYWLFRVLSRAPGISVLSIVPVKLRPETAAITNGWVHDPQLWDYATCEPDPDADLEDLIGTQANGRRVLAFVGSITRSKGTALLESVARRADLSRDVLVVAAGKVGPDAVGDATRLREAGAIVEDRRVSDREIEALYRQSDLVWCCYHPDYDQASGVYGRAVQFGRTTIVREGSMLDQYNETLAAPSVRIPWNDQPEAGRRIRVALRDRARSGPAVKPAVDTWRERFRQKVLEAL